MFLHFVASFYNLGKNPEELDFEPLEAFEALRKNPSFLSQTLKYNEIRDDDSETDIFRVKRKNDDNDLISIINMNKNAKINDNKMDEKIKELPENSKFLGSEFFDN